MQNSFFQSSWDADLHRVQISKIHEKWDTPQFVYGKFLRKAFQNSLNFILFLSIFYSSLSTIGHYFFPIENSAFIFQIPNCVITPNFYRTIGLMRNGMQPSLCPTVIYASLYPGDPELCVAESSQEKKMKDCNSAFTGKNQQAIFLPFHTVIRVEEAS